MLTRPDENLTLEAVGKELADLENDYRLRRKRLRALLAVLEAEAENPARVWAAVKGESDVS